MLRIKKGPLKGYLCRVVRIFRNDVTVKLDSLLKIVTGWLAYILLLVRGVVWTILISPYVQYKLIFSQSQLIGGKQLKHV